MNCAYILRCSDGTLYTGWTSDLKRRVKKHNSGAGAKYTRSRLPVQVVYCEQYEDKRQAQRREYAIKRLSRDEKEALIEKQALYYGNAGLYPDAAAGGAIPEMRGSAP